MKTISRVTLGTAQLTSMYGIANTTERRPTPEHAEGMLRSAIMSGFTSLDTAPSYGESERVIGSFLQESGRSDVFVCTKLPSASRSSVPFSEIDAFVDENITRSTDALGREIDCYLLHDCADVIKYGSRIVHSLERHRERGAIRRSGVSVYDEDEMMLCLKYPLFEAVQFPANLFDHRFLSERSAAFFHDHGLIAFARSIYLQGLFLVDPSLSHPQVARAADALERLRAYARRTGWGLDALAFAFVSSFPHVNSMVIGMEKPEQIERNREHLEKRLPDEMREEILRLFRDVADTISDPRLWGR